MASSEPGITASIIGGGVSFVTLSSAGYDVLIESGVKPKLANFIVMAAMLLVSIGAAAWARRRTVTTADYKDATAVALALPAHATTEDLNKKLAAQPEPLPAVETAKKE